LINFTDLIFSKDYLNKEDYLNDMKIPNILILGDLTYGTGNLITAQRVKKILKDLNMRGFYYNIRYLLSGEDENLENLKKFIINKNISMLIGINVWRAGKIIYDLQNKNDLNELNSIFNFI
jgi:hypothetical protein